MHPDTVSLANPFFADVGLIVRTESGYTPAPGVLNFARVLVELGKASSELAPELRDTWFADVLLSHLEFAPMSASTRSPSSRKSPTQTRCIGNSLASSSSTAAAGLVENDGGTLKPIVQREARVFEKSGGGTTETVTGTAISLSPPSSRPVVSTAPSGLPR